MFSSPIRPTSLTSRLRQIATITKFSEQREAESSLFAVAFLYGRSVTLLALLYVVFTYGLRASLPGGAPYFNFFAPGFIAWVFFQDSVSQAYSYVKSNRFVTENSNILVGDLISALLLKNFKVQVLLVATYINGRVFFE